MVRDCSFSMLFSNIIGINLCLQNIVTIGCFSSGQQLKRLKLCNYTSCHKVAKAQAFKNSGFVTVTVSNLKAAFKDYWCC